jgi:hypothetical protein
MPFRCTAGIVSDTPQSDAAKEADVIMTAVMLGFSASQIKNNHPVRFDTDPGDPIGDIKKYYDAVSQISHAVEAYFVAKGLLPRGSVGFDLAPNYSKGAVVVGVYKIAGHPTPVSVSDPVLSPKGQALYKQIAEQSSSTPQYIGRGAYTGFVDNRNTTGNTDPVGPRSTVRFLTANPDHVPADDPTLSGLHPRWMPPYPATSPLWSDRLRKNPPRGKESPQYVPWGMIGGNKAINDPNPRITNRTGATNEADQITGEMHADGMEFAGEPTMSDIVAYTHGMTQALYKAYVLGPSCTPFEIAVGTQTTKMASCFACTMFMTANGYPPNSIHLGRGESWAPLYLPHNPDGRTEPHELEVIRDFNAKWRTQCREWLTLGLDVLSPQVITDDHVAAKAAVQSYLGSHGVDPTVAATIILDALTVHESESTRVARTLKPIPPAH